MPPRCAHLLSANKRTERLENVATFIKGANQTQLGSKLLDMWESPSSHISELRMLLTFGANPAGLYEEDSGRKTVEERRKSGSLCEACALQFDDFLDKAGVIYEEQFEQTPINIVRGRKLAEGLLPMCLDGGGMRGLVSVVCLLFASRRLFGDESLPNYFDWLVGTSTGSMLSLAMTKGSSLKDCFFLYWDMKKQIFMEGSTMGRLFGDQVRQQTNNINECLESAKCAFCRTFPTQTMHACPRRLTVPALDISCSPARLHIFRNYSLTCPFGVKLDPEVDKDYSFRDVTRSSSAAPTYFEPHVVDGMKLVDGSFVANCPLNVLFKEVDALRKHSNPVKLMGVLSIGTGEPERVERKYKHGTSIKKKALNIANLSTLILEQVCGHDLSVVEMARDRCHAHNIPFFRLSPSGINVRIDQVNEDKLMQMLWTCQVWLSNNFGEVDRLGELLHKLFSDPDDRKRRSNTIL
ncbi:hypothetical protein PFISCL1PPCAC_14413 [Pristionchus fissidentatus]|uniref:PNPLA domain-containing protein n=1 Tax=Pristionchus fissidentatus TaxID=1538716 RepID=A0AAV5VTU0_9BILA|nr:hypothetical protein PFISCL1PPCAC_14413 [Pristionchus fissidentatus]